MKLIYLNLKGGYTLNKKIKFSMQFKNRLGTLGSISLDYIKENPDKTELENIAKFICDKELFIIDSEPATELIGAKLVVSDTESII